MVVRSWRFRLARKLYTLLIFLLIPAVFGYFLWRSRREPQYCDYWPERFSRAANASVAVPRGWAAHRSGASAGAASAPRFWLHAASLGEMRVAGVLLRALAKHYPGMQVFLTTLTPAGRAEAEALQRENLPVTLRYLPVDTPGLMQALVRAVNPDLVILIETELWPNMLWQCRRADVPVALVNGRLSPHRRATYMRFAALYSPLVAGLTWVAAQSPRDAAAFRALGAESVTVTGNLKFDGATVAREPVLARSRFDGDWLWLAGSTHPGEEAILLRVHQRLARKHSRQRLQLILAPRHPSRAEELRRLASAEGLTVVLRSNLGDEAMTAQVLLLDSFGELTGLYRGVDAAFIGGSLVAHGGQNPLEAVAAGCPVLMGPHTANFADIISGLKAQEALLQVRDEDSLLLALESFLLQPQQGREMAARAQDLLRQGRGATERAVALINATLQEPAGHNSGRML